MFGNWLFGKRGPSRFKVLETLDDMESMLLQSEEKPVLVFKHSVLCSLSAWARRQIELEIDPERNEIPLYEINVQRSRNISNAISRLFSIQHESPQAFIIHERSVISHCSHGQISREWLFDILRSEPVGHEG